MFVSPEFLPVLRETLRTAVLAGYSDCRYLNDFVIPSGARNLSSICPDEKKRDYSVAAATSE